jgi:cytochrome c oxidase subunit II
MKIHTYEKAFLGAGIVLLIACMLALAYASIAHGLALPGRTARLDPTQVYTTPPFNEPGVREIAPGRYEVVMIGQAWSFNPAEVRVPVGAEVTFMITSPDVLHGMHIERTRVNVMLIPGQVSRVRHTFRERGEHLIICHEYCGIGHHLMHGRIIVE